MKYIAKFNNNVQEATSTMQQILSKVNGYLGPHGIVQDKDKALRFDSKSAAEFAVDSYGYRNATIEEVD